MSKSNNITLNPTLFLKMVFNGGKQIVQSESKLNQLNVYPVPDGDTGSNMAALMRYMLSQQYPTGNFGELLTALADASLIGSCGNSGMILSSFFVGLALDKSISDKTELSIAEFVNIAKSGVEQAHRSVAEPVEGTILTVMQAWLDALTEQYDSCADFQTLFNATLPAAESALTQTEFQLPTLEENSVVDAGAFGFTKMLQGMDEALEDDSDFDTHWEDNAVFSHDVAHAHHHAELSEDAYQYCYETLLSGNTDQIDALNAELGKFSDSIVLNQSPSHIKAHIHTTDIMRATEVLKKYGTIIHQKIDDMKIQWAISEHRKHKVAIVTDSSADIPEDFKKEAQIHTIPMQVRLGNHSLLDRLTIDLPTLYEQINSYETKTTTSAPTAEIVKRYLHFLSSHYDSIIVLTVSSGMSSTHQLIKNQADHLTGLKIDVVDSKTIAAGHGLLVMKAANLIASGMSHDQAVAELEKARERIKVYLAIDEMQSMRESGRVSKIVHKIADWGHLKPILSLDEKGNPSVAGLTLGKQKAWKKIYSLIGKFANKATRSTTLISHTATKEKVNTFIEQLQKATGTKVKEACETAPSLGVHAGRGSIAVAIMDESI